MSLNDWEAVNINNSGNFPALSNHAMCLAVHKDFRVRCLGRLEYLKGCTSMGDKLEKIAKLEKSGIYIYGGLNYDNKVSDSLIFLTVDGLSQEWKTIKPTGKSPPPLYDHTMDFMKPSKPPFHPSHSSSTLHCHSNHICSQLHRYFRG